MLIKNSEQHCLKPGDTCDQCQEETGVTFEKRYAHVAQGATGRWCEVLWICDRCGDDYDNAMTAHEARTWCNQQPASRADF